MNALTPTVTREDAAAVLERVVVQGDLSRLSAEEKINYYNAVCQSVGLNPLTRPLEYVRLSGKEVLYARRDCADQLRKLNGISIEVVSKGAEDGLFIVHVRATDRTGRSDEDFGAVPFPSNLSGEPRANAILKAITKAKRRATLSISGLGLLDETEVESVQTATGERQQRPSHRGNVLAAAEGTPPPPHDDAAQPEPGPRIAYVAANGAVHACADAAQWRSDWLKRIKALVLAGRQAELREAWERNAEAIQAVGEGAPLVANEVVQAIRDALGHGDGPDEPEGEAASSGDAPNAAPPSGSEPAEPEPPEPEQPPISPGWWIVSSTGAPPDECADGGAWVRGWQHRIQAVGKSTHYDAAGKRDKLVAMRTVNAPVFKERMKAGFGEAVAEVHRMLVEASNRLGRTGDA